MKKINILILTVVMMLLFSGQVYAEESTYTGWVYSQGAPVYLVNGVKLVNTWIKNGETYYYLGEYGTVVPNFVVNSDGLMASSINQYYDVVNKTTNVVNRPVVVPYAAVKDFFNVSNDYEAFMKLHPEVVSTFGDNKTGLYDYYLSTYHGQTPGSVYLAALERCLTTSYNGHDYTYLYSYVGNDQHKAQCSCGQWIYEPCNREDRYHHKDKCSKCGNMMQ